MKKSMLLHKTHPMALINVFRTKNSSDDNKITKPIGVYLYSIV